MEQKSYVWNKKLIIALFLVFAICISFGIGAIQTKKSAQDIYTFRSEDLLEEHYQKHGVEMGFATKEAYVSAANAVIHSPDALHKLEAEDGDDVYYLEATNEFVIVSTDGYIRTYFYPNDGKDYFDRQ